MRWYYFFLLAVVVGYSVYLLSFTLFDGFSTFSNDAASYVLAARKWSPFFDPSAAESYTVPFLSYPPGFPGLLAITGASESLWSAHLVVSICMLASLLVMGFFLGKETSGPLAALTMLSICSMPGIIVNSLGILSENLYLLLSLGALTVYSSLRERTQVSWGWNVGLIALITAAVMTRAAGVALIAAFLIVPALDRQLVPRQRVVIPLAAVLSFLVWQGWDAGGLGQGVMTYGHVSEYFVSQGLSLGEQISAAWQSIYANLVALLWAWNHYFFLTNFDPWFFAFSYLWLAICTVCLGLRFAKFRIDAVYIVLYVGVVLLWPFPQELDRFLHPIALLMVAQPVLFVSGRGRQTRGHWTRMAVVGVLLALVIQTGYAQLQLHKLQREAKAEFPALAHSYEYYAGEFGYDRLALAQAYSVASGFIKTSSDRIPESSIVAAVKHEMYALLADRKAVASPAVVPFHQQICNFLLSRVDTVFLSQVTSPLNERGLELLNEYQPFAREVFPLEAADSPDMAYVIMLDRASIEEELNSVGFECERIIYAPSPESARKAMANHE